MSVWDKYEKRIDAYGRTNRDSAKKREIRMLDRKLKDSLSYHEILVNNLQRVAAIVDSDNLNEKVMFSLPGEDFTCGELVEWADNHWLITEKDANNEIYTRVKLLQCNHLLHWVDDDNIIRSQWCVIEDGTKLRTISFRVVEAA